MAVCNVVDCSPEHISNPMLGPATSEPLSFGWWKVGYSLFQTLNAREIDYLDLVVVTHNDHDHVNGIAALLVSLIWLIRSFGEVGHFSNSSVPLRAVLGIQQL